MPKAVPAAVTGRLAAGVARTAELSAAGQPRRDTAAADATSLARAERSQSPPAPRPSIRPFLEPDLQPMEDEDV